MITPPRPICAAHYSFGEASTFQKTFRYKPPVVGEEAGEEAEAHPMIPGGDVDFAFATGYGQVQILVRLTQPWVRPAFTAVSPTSSRATGSNTPAGGGSQDL